MQIYEELVARGLIAQVTDEKKVRELYWLLIIYLLRYIYQRYLERLRWQNYIQTQLNLQLLLALLDSVCISNMDTNTENFSVCIYAC